MTGSRDKPDSKDEREAAVSAEPRTPRRPYHAPRLRQLGSVRELTLGSPAGKLADGAGAKKAM